FVRITRLLQEASVHVPQILEQDLDQGFLLISDLGRQNYYQAIQKGLDDIALQGLYRDAISALVRIQRADTSGLPVYDQSRLLQELELFAQWYARLHCRATLTGTDLEMLKQTFELLTRDNAGQARVFVHRDFHSPNLMLCGGPGQEGNPGVIDYQDAL